MMAQCFFCEVRPAVAKRATMYLGDYYVQMPICKDCLAEEGLSPDEHGEYYYDPKRDKLLQAALARD